MKKMQQALGKKLEKMKEKMQKLKRKKTHKTWK